MMTLDTSKMYALFNYIVKYKTENDGNSPSYAQMRDACGFTSTDSVSRYIRALEQDEAITVHGVKDIRVSGGEWRMN